MNYYEYEIQSFTFFCILTLMLIIIMIFFFNTILPFLKERQYIKMEIARSGKKEKCYWERRLKQLYTRHIPVLGRFIR